jgi:L-rhamnose isomerase/sugar isomerase
MIQSVMNIQTAYAKALLVDEERIAVAQADGDVLGAHRVLLDAFESDVRPLLTRWRGERGVDADPVEAFRAGGYAERLTAERGTSVVESAYETT